MSERGSLEPTVPMGDGDGMTQRVDSPSKRASIARRIFVGQDDVAAAERLLALIANASGAEAALRADDGQPGPARSAAIQQAKAALALRQRRVRTFEGSFSSEPPFALMLALYANQDHEPTMTYSRLVQTGWVSAGNAARWIDRLSQEGWLERKNDASDQRKVLVSLSPKALEALDQLFSWPEDG